jgi:hypothetical protein
METRSAPNDKANKGWTTLHLLPATCGIQIISVVLAALATDAPASLSQVSAIEHLVCVHSNHTETTNPCPIRTNSRARIVLEQGVVHDDTDTAQEAPAMVGGLLHVTLASTAAGTESDHLPDCYAPLHQSRPSMTGLSTRWAAPKPYGREVVVCVLFGFGLDFSGLPLKFDTHWNRVSVL